MKDHVTVWELGQSPVSFAFPELYAGPIDSTPAVGEVCRFGTSTSDWRVKRVIRRGPARYEIHVVLAYPPPPRHCWPLGPRITW